MSILVGLKENKAKNIQFMMTMIEKDEINIIEEKKKYTVSASESKLN